MSYLHITFANGSNPYLSYGDKRKVENEIKRWSRNYVLDLYPDEEGNVNAKATLRSEDTRFIAQLPKAERERIKRHIRYKLKKANVYYLPQDVYSAMTGRVCDVYGK